MPRLPFPWPGALRCNPALAGADLLAALSGLAQNFVSEALCLLGMSWVGGEQPAAPESSPNCRDPTCRNPHPPEVPRQGNLERKASGQICIQGRTPLEQWREAHALLSRCSQGSQLMPGMSVVVGAAGTSPFLEHTRLFRVLLFCMWSPQPEVPVSPSHCMAP